jgi:hypothetical protein
VITATDHFLVQHEQVLNEVLSIVNLSCLVLTNNSKAPAMIAERYGIREDDAMMWFKELEYACHQQMNEQQWNDILTRLLKFEIINRKPELSEICYGKNIELVY